MSTPARDGPGGQPLGVDAATVVRELDVDPPALVGGPDRRQPSGSFRRRPLGGRLDPVVDGVAHEMQQRIA